MKNHSLCAFERVSLFDGESRTISINIPESAFETVDEDVYKRQLRDVWVQRFEDAAEAIEIRDPSNARGLLPAFCLLYTSQMIVSREYVGTQTVTEAFIPIISEDIRKKIAEGDTFDKEGLSA